MPTLIDNCFNKIAEYQEDDLQLNQIKHKLESDFKSKIDVVKLKEIIKFFVAIENLQKYKKQTKDFKKNSQFYEEIYKNINQIIIVLSQFLNNENPVFQEILWLKNRYKWKYYFFEGAYLIEDANKFTNSETNEVTNIEEFLNNYLKAVEIFLKLIEECYPYLELEEIDYVEQPILILLRWLEDEQQEIENQYKPLIKKIILITKAILWEITRVKSNKIPQLKPTVANLSKYLEIASGWHGNDFEECLKFINEMRRD